MIKPGRTSYALALTVGLQSCGWLSKPQVVTEPTITVSPERPNIVFITLDTVRADRLGASGYAQGKTDTIDRLAAAGRRYSRAYSPLPLTIPAHSTMFTGLYPPHHGIRGNGQGTLGEERVTLAETLQAAGWRTGASIAAFVTTRVWGFSQGFDAYLDTVPTDRENFWHGERGGDLVVDDALKWVGEQTDDRPLFLWVHLYDAHFPYMPPEAYLKLTENRPYDGEIAFIDDQIQRLVDAFAAEPTIFVLVGDHGEGLGEHHELNHGLYAYDSTQLVPFIMSGTGIEPAVIDQPVSLADVAPTLLSAVGLALPDGIDGRVITADNARPVYVESYQLSQRFGLAPHVGVIDGRYKLLDTPRPELYDLLEDRGELKDVSAAHPEEVARLKGLLAGLAMPPPAEEAGAIDPALQAQLEQLGYVQGSQKVEPGTVLPDPKDHEDLVIGIQKAERKTLLREVDAAVEVLQDLIKRYPAVVEFRSRLAALYGRQKKLDLARAEIEAALKIDPKNPMLRSALAGHLAEAGKFREATEIFQQLADEMPYTPRIRVLAVNSLRHTGEVKSAVELGFAYMEEYPDDLELAGAVGVMVVDANQIGPGMELVRKGSGAPRPEAEVAWLMGAEAVGKGNLELARTWMEKEVENYPNNLKAWYALARVSMRQQRWEGQLAAADKVLERMPKDTEMLYLRVLALFNLMRYPDAREAVDTALKVDPGDPELMLMDANLLAKEGKKELGAARFEEAKAALASRTKPAVTNDLGIPLATQWKAVPEGVPLAPEVPAASAPPAPAPPAPPVTPAAPTP